MPLTDPVMNQNFDRLAVLFGGRLDNLPDAAKSESAGFMDAHFDRLYTDGPGRIAIALAHYYRVNGDSVPDPDMELMIDLNNRTVEALTYQDVHRYNSVYDEGVVNQELRRSLNDFLRLWLSNLAAQGHQFRGAV